MNLHAKFTGERARKQAVLQPPFGPGFDAGIVGKTETVEVFGSGFKDPGSDFCEFRAFDAKGELISTGRIGGY